ncbi:unnamed protein product [Umbelopsis ramanniana]
MKLTLLPWLLLAIGSASATSSGHHESSASTHKSVAAHTQHIRSLPTLYDRHCKTDDDCPDVHCCNLWTQRCVLDPLGTICDIKPTTTLKKKTTTLKKSTTKTSTRPHTTTQKSSKPTDKSQPVGVLSETNPSSTPDPTTSAGDEGTTGDQPVVNYPNAPASNPTVATTTLSPSFGTPTAPVASSTSTTDSNNGGNNGSQNNLANLMSSQATLPIRKLVLELALV